MKNWENSLYVCLLWIGVGVAVLGVGWGVLSFFMGETDTQLEHALSLLTDTNMIVYFSNILKIYT